ncbi:glycosyltransferase family 4 protein [Cohnella sp. REN36]|uniref:glycosyltransferase family 4 protein n=1 Tax=Cohnella sp. REN36 TaxID=2887347 RepID=UPI001D135C7D|nr:glycosyltransferase family 4 protein [Cohnella sp. REN36]MCC3376000.1 glycosyltransferase family 4 protein [Cohnella sp. REN36]
MKKPHIVFVLNYFYPDLASIAQLLTELVTHLKDDFRLTVITAQPGYAGEEVMETKRVAYDQMDQIRIIRIKLPKVNKRNKFSRLKYISTYFFYANFLLLRQKDVDLIYTTSQPPILGGLIGTIGKIFKRCMHVYNIQDFNPEQAEATGFMKSRLVFRIAKWIDNLNCRFADHIVTIGQEMQETLKKRFSNRTVPESSVIFNWANEEDIVPLPKEYPQVEAFKKQYGLLDKFIVMYSGNIGLYYDLENLIKIAYEFRDVPDLAFVFIGEGAVKQTLVDYANEHHLQNVYFVPYQLVENLKYSLNAADIHLVVNQKGIKGVSVPSKIYGVMAAGKPVLGVLEKGSEAHRLIQESGCGNVVEPQQYAEIIACIKEMYAMNRDDLVTRGLKGRQYLDQHLRKDIALDQYLALLKTFRYRSQYGQEQRMEVAK